MNDAKPATSVSKKNAPPGWQTYTSEKGDYSVLFPGAVKETEIPGEGFTIYMAVCEVGDVGYIAAYQPINRTSNASDKQLLDAGQENAARKTHGRIVSSHDISLQGYPGREYLVDAPKMPPQIPTELLSKTRMYLVKDRLYMLNVTMEKDKPGNSQAETFFKSFQLLQPDK